MQYLMLHRSYRARVDGELKLRRLGHPHAHPGSNMRMARIWSSNSQQRPRPHALHALYLGAARRKYTPESHSRMLHPSIAPSPAAEPWPEPSANHQGLRASGNRPCTGHLPEDGLILPERLHKLLGVAVLLLRLPARLVDVATRHAGRTRLQPVPPTVASSRPACSETTMRS